MIVVEHRRNTLAQAAALAPGRGAELDVRLRGDALVVAHDPLQDGPALAAWLAASRAELLVVNVKEEGLEPLLLPVLAGAPPWFLLGVDPGWALAWLDALDGRVAVRVGDLHGTRAAWRLAGRARWLWLEHHRGVSGVSADELRALTEAGYAVCVGSPELFGAPVGAVPHARQALAGVPVAAVVTKVPDAWGPLTPA